MSIEKEDVSAVIAVLKRIDWPRVLHLGSTLLRAVRGDADIDSDAERMKRNGERARGAVEQAGRAADGCVAPNACSCAFCAEKRETP